MTESKRDARAVQSFLPFVPPTVTHNDLEAYMTKKDGKAITAIRKSDRLKEAEDMMLPYVRRMAESGTGLPLTGAVAETLKVCWPCGDGHVQGSPRTDPPDLDNWEKTFNDLCERAGIIVDDAQIAAKHSYKLWSDPPGVFVRFEEIG